MILGTAGHIDHGKTSLVKALTGIETDRLPEEKRRGITIELGFAPLHLDGLEPIGVVDVPGHEAFVRTMLAGATGVDLALLVVAADEGIMPQTREHLAILNLLGVRGGVVALTKSDLVEADWIALVEEEVRVAISGGALDGAPIVRCSARTGDGIAALKSALITAANAVPARAADDLFRMPIDRAFSVKGTGTVVTGTIWSGELAAEDLVVLLPAGTEARVRGVERHGEAAASAVAGARTAVALGGVDRAEIDVRGTVVVRAGDPWVTTRVLRADVALLESAPAVGQRTKVRFHLGTADVAARIVAVGGPLRAGSRVPVRVVLDAPVVARAGDRFVVRISSPAATIGGGVVTDPAPVGRRVRPWAEVGASDEQRFALLLADAGGQGVAIASLPVRLGRPPSGSLALLSKLKRSVVVAGERCFDPAVAKSVETRCMAAIRAAHELHPLEPGLPVQSLRSSLRVAPELVDLIVERLAESSKISVADGRAARAGWLAGGGEADSRRTAAVLALLTAAGIQPPSVDELSVIHGNEVFGVLKLLARRGDVIAVATDRYFTKAAVDDLVGKTATALAEQRTMTASQLREALGVTRKYLIPFLEYCDRQGITVRRGDDRLLGKLERRES